MDLVQFRGGTYTLSWEMYRALAGQPYSGSDKCLDDVLDAGTTRQVMTVDTQGGILFKQMPIGLARKFEESQERRERGTSLREMWRLYDELFSKYAYCRLISESLYQFKTTLETMNA